MFRKTREIMKFTCKAGRSRYTAARKTSW